MPKVHSSLPAGAGQLKALENLDQISSGISQLNASVSDGDFSLKSGTAGLSSSLGDLYDRIEKLAENASVIGNASHKLEGSADSLRSASAYFPAQFPKSRLPGSL